MYRIPFQKAGFNEDNGWEFHPETDQTEAFFVWRNVDIDIEIVVYFIHSITKNQCRMFCYLAYYKPSYKKVDLYDHLLLNDYTISDHAIETKERIMKYLEENFQKIQK